MVSKSANYCHAENSDNTGLLLLCRVALGTPNKLYRADYNANKLPARTNSTFGVGSTAPAKSANETFRGMTVPTGKGVPSGETGCSLLYNEFIIYDTKQAQIEYVVKCKFNYRWRKGGK